MLLSNLLPFALAAVAVARPSLKRSKAQVITNCAVPNTAALTFVSGSYVGFRVRVHYLFTFQDDGPYIYL